MITLRIRSAMWFASGLAVALMTVAVFVGLRVSAADPPTVWVPMTPCRLFDTRPAGDNVGPRATPIGPAETYVKQVTGAVGECFIPPGAAAVSMNVTATNATTGSFLQLWPSDSARPGRGSSLNYVAGQSPTPNKVDVQLSPSGTVSIFNLAGKVDVLADVVGYYIPVTAETEVRSITVPAQSLNHVAGSVITDHVSGLRWTNSFGEFATLAVRRPPDWTGSAQVIVKVTYTRTNSNPGGVQFFVRPRDFNPGDPLVDASSIVSGIDTSTGLQYRDATFVIPPAELQKPIWEITLQRDSTIAGAFTGDVVVRSVELSYLAVN